jgi:hypothetical protein
VTYAAVYAQQQAETATTLRNFFHWVIADGQSFARELHYAPLPPRIVPAIRDRINQISPSMVHPPRDGQP